MLLLKLSDTQGAMFDELPEADLGLHFPRVEDELGFVPSGRVLMLPVTKRTEGLEQSDTLAKTLWFGPEVRRFDPKVLEPLPSLTNKEIEAEESLINALHNAPPNMRYPTPRTL